MSRSSASRDGSAGLDAQHARTAHWWKSATDATRAFCPKCTWCKSTCPVTGREKAFVHSDSIVFFCSADDVPCALAQHRVVSRSNPIVEQSRFHAESESQRFEQRRPSREDLWRVSERAHTRVRSCHRASICSLLQRCHLAGADRYGCTGKDDVDVTQQEQR